MAGRVTLMYQTVRSSRNAPPNVRGFSVQKICMAKIGWYDIESTGKKVATDRIVQLSLIKKNGLYDIIDKRKMFFNPGMPIHPEAIRAHGITNEMVATCQPFSMYAAAIHKWISDCDYVGGFNIKQFDNPMLAEEFARCGIDWVPKGVIDNSVIFKKREQRNLSAALMFYTGEQLEGAHDAENDVLATIKVAIGQVIRYKFDELYTTEDSILPVPVEIALAQESIYEGEQEKIDIHNKIKLNDDGVPVFNFGKHFDKNVPVISDPNYCDWLLALNDFPATTKNLIRRISNQPK